MNSMLERETSKIMRQNYRYNATWLLYGFLGLAIALVSSGKRSNENGVTSQPIPVEVSIPIQKDVQIQKRFTGRFKAVNQVDVRARVSGYLTAIKFKEGDDVKKGDVLFIIDQRIFQIALDEALANLARQKSIFEQSQNNFARVQDLIESGAISIEDFDSRKQQLESSRAGIASAEAQVAKARLDLEFSVVRAPISGRVGREMVNVGNLISGGSPNATLLTTIVKADPIHFYFTGSESDFLSINGSNNSEKKGVLGDTLKLKLQGQQGYMLSGIMDYQGNTIDESTGTIELRALLKNEARTIEPGMFGEALLLGSRLPGAFLVPDDLISTNQNIRYLYKVNTENMVEIAPVELGGLYDGNLRLIQKGLEPHDKIIINNIQKIRPGMPVTPIESSMTGESGKTQNTEQ